MTYYIAYWIYANFTRDSVIFYIYTLLPINQTENQLFYSDE